ncbi:unnamed protein product [Effrenium voratum]|nr:unnamed protein product [Effrenium voratum]
MSRPACCPSYILQHYHSTGCCGGAFSFRAALLDPSKELHICLDPREYRNTNMEDIELSLADKRRGGGPRVGAFQGDIPGDHWKALPKYDFTTKNRSSAFNERMHVEWENHVDHILQNGGQLPIASVVAKAGFRSCAPCCRDMLALAKPTGKTFIMVDLAEDSSRGTFHFVTGSNYLPVPKEACTDSEVEKLKRIVLDAQAGRFESSREIYEAVLAADVPIDTTAQALYGGDSLLPSDCAEKLCDLELLQAVHAEHFARLAAEYGASIFRDPNSTPAQREAVLRCRQLARQQLVSAWRPVLQAVKVDLDAYADLAVAPLLPESPDLYLHFKRSKTLPRAVSPAVSSAAKPKRWRKVPDKAPAKASFGEKALDDDLVSTVVPEDSEDIDLEGFDEAL